MFSAADELSFRQRWASLWPGHHAPPAVDPLLTLYAVPHRHYHNARHILECFAHHDASLAATGEVPSLAFSLALFYHDGIYDPRAADNEARSAELAAQHLREHVSAETLSNISRLIRATDHRTPPALPDEQRIVDIDLAILGQPATRFDAYENAIRREYAHVAEDAFRSGRAKVLQHFLAREAIFHTPFFSQQYEAPARVNLTRSLTRLRTPC